MGSVVAMWALVLAWTGLVFLAGAATALAVCRWCYGSSPAQARELTVRRWREAEEARTDEHGQVGEIHGGE